MWLEKIPHNSSISHKKLHGTMGPQNFRITKKTEERQTDGYSILPLGHARSSF